MDLKGILKLLPQNPGVYMMMDSLGNIIYIGKAKNLKNRVSQYFQNQKERSSKVVEMIHNIHTIKYIVTDTELDALIDECRLIKEIQPRYNRQMKNDKKYIYIKIPAEQYPKVMRANEKADDGALYFGPFTSPHLVETTLQYLNEFYPIRKCTSPGLISRVSGCLFHQLGTCLGVCTRQVSQDQYWIHIEKIQQLLNGDAKASAEELLKKMNAAIENLKFEKASQYHDYYLGLRHIMGKQQLIQSSSKNRTVIAVEFIDNEHAKLFLIQGNRLLYRRVINIVTIDQMELMQLLKDIFREKLTAERGVTTRLTQYDIDEAQIIYSYLRKNKKSILSFSIPFTKLHKEGPMNSTLSKIICQITTRKSSLDQPVKDLDSDEIHLSLN